MTTGMQKQRSKHAGDHDYRVHVLAACKALAWLSFPAVFIAMAIAGVGHWISNWAERGFLNGKIWEGYVLSPLMWAAIAALVAVAAYSTVVEWFWDAWDRKVKYIPIGKEREEDREAR